MKVNETLFNPALNPSLNPALNPALIIIRNNNRNTALLALKAIFIRKMEPSAQNCIKGVCKEQAESMCVSPDIFKTTIFYPKSHPGEMADSQREGCQPFAVWKPYWLNNLGDAGIGGQTVSGRSQL